MSHPTDMSSQHISVNAQVTSLVEHLRLQARTLGLLESTDASGARIIDASHAGTAAGQLIASLCMGGLGQVDIQPGAAHAQWLGSVVVKSAQPVLACLASQYAGWSLQASKEETGGKKFFALGSGPIRALVNKEDILKELGYQDHIAPLTGATALILEVNGAPPAVVMDKVLKASGVRPEQLTVIITPITSVAGTTQVVARVLEVAMHKVHELGFPLVDVIEGQGVAPLPPPGVDQALAMGRSNDAILYGGQVHLSVRGSDDAARQLAKQLPSSNSKDHGRPFADIFKDYNHDFYQVDPGLFAPAEVWVSNLDSGNTWHAGATNMPLLMSQWQQEA